MTNKLPNFKDSQGRILVPISEASKILGVSVDTLRRWDEKGKIVSRRPDGKNRYFALQDIENFKASKTFSIGEAAEFLGISHTTLRRLDERGILPAERVGAERVYRLPELEEFSSSQYFQTKKNLERLEKDVEVAEAKTVEVHSSEKDRVDQIVRIINEDENDLDSLVSWRSRLAKGAVLAVLICLIIVFGVTSSFLVAPIKTAQFMGFVDSNGNKLIASPNVSTAGSNSYDVLGASSTLTVISEPKYEQPGAAKSLIRSVLLPFTRVSLAIIDVVDHKKYEKVIPRNINEIFAFNKKNELVPLTPIDFATSDLLKVGDKGLIKNLNADYLRGRVPGTGPGNLVYYNSKGEIEGYTEDTYYVTQPFTGILPLANGGTGANLTLANKGGLIFLSGNKLNSTGPQNGVIIATGSGAFGAVAGTPNYLIKWNSSGNSLSSQSMIYDNGSVGIGNTDPGQALDVSGNIYARGGQIRIGNFAAPPGAIGAGSLYYDTGSNQVFYFNGTNWQAFGTGSGGDSVWTTGTGVIYPTNLTVDALIGGTASVSAKFGFVNVLAGTPSIQINGTTVLDPTTLGSGVVTSSLTSVGALTSGSIASGFGTISTTNTITGTTVNGTTGVNTGAGAGTQRIDASGNLVNIGTITSGLINGQTISNAANFTGTLAVSGAVTLSNYNTNGGVFFANGSGLLSQTGAGTSSQCLLGGTTPTFGSCGTGLATNWWTTSSDGKALTPINSTMDFLLGGQATTSAKFAVLGLNDARGSQTASLSGSIVLDNTASIQTTKNQSLRIGGSSTGNINLEPSSTLASGYVFIGSAGLSGIANPDFLVLDQASGALPSAINGSLAMDSTGKISVYENGQWKVLCNTTDAACGAGSGSALSAITAATGANTINSGDNGQVWNWSLASLNRTAFTIGENSASSGNNTTILKISTMANSTAMPLQIIAQGNTVLNVSNIGGITLGANAGNGNISISPNAGGQAALIVNKLGDNDLFTASAAGTTRFIIANNGALTASAYANAGGILYTSTTGLIGQTSAGASSQCLLGGTTPTFGSCATGTNQSPFQVLNGAIVPLNSTLDFLVGGQATTSADFAFIRVNSGTPTASISAGTTNNNTFLTGGGNLATTNGQTLTLGGSSTGLIQVSNKAGSVFSTFDTVNSRLGIGTSTPNGALTIGSGQILVPGGSKTVPDIALTGSTNTGLYFGSTAGGSVAFTTAGVPKFFFQNLAQRGFVMSNNISLSWVSTSDATSVAPDVFISRSAAGVLRISSDEGSGTADLVVNGKLGVGTTSINSALYVTHPLTLAVTGKSLAVFDQIEQQDIFTASASGTPIFTITRAGGIALGTNGLSTGTSSQCLLGGSTASWGSCGTGTGTNWWTTSADGKALTPINSTMDFLLGSQATTSAKFAVLGLNNARGSQTASVAGSFVVDSSTGSLQATNNQTLTIGGNTTGNILLMPNNNTSGGFVGIGTTAPTNRFEIQETKTDTSGFTQMQFNRVTANPTGASTATYVANYNESRTNSGNSQSFSNASVVGLYNLAQHRGTNTLTNAYGVEGIVKTDNTGTITNARAFYALGQMTTAAGTMTNYSGFYAGTPTIAGGGSIGSAYGVYVEALTVGLSNYGARIDAASTQTLWLSGNADNTTAASGIAFGSSRDTNLYRSAADTLKTDDAFNVNGNFNVTSAGAISAATGITSSGTITFSTFNSNGGVLYTNGSGVLAQATAGTSSQCLLGGTTPTFGSCGAGLATNWWTTSSDGKALAPINSTMDFLLGGTSTASARFAVLGLAGSTPQTSVSGRLIVMPSNGYGNVGINTTNPVVPFDSNGRARIAGSSGSVGDSGFGNYALSVQNNASTSWLEILNNGGAGKGAFFGMSGNDFEQYNYQGGDIIFYANTTPSTSTERLRIAANGNVGIGTDSTPNALFNVGNNSEFQVNSSGAIAAATGIASSGTINFSGLSASSAIYTDGSKNLTSTAPTTGTIGYWSRSAQGALTPATTNDVVAATSSAYNPFTATTNNPAGTLANNTLIQHIAAGTVTNLLTLSRTAGTVTTGLNLTGTIGTDISLQNSATISNASAGTLALTATNIAVNGNLRGATDDTFFSWDYTTNRIGFTKKSGGAGKLTYGSGNSFAIAQSNATGIEATNTFTDRFVLDTSGNVTIGAGNLTMTSGTSFSATALTTLTTSSSVSWGGLTAMTFTADNAVVSGSDVANGNLSLQGTTNATRTTSYVLLQPNGGFVGVGNSAPTVALDVTGDLSASGIMTAGSFVTSNWTIDQNGTCAGSGRLCFDYSGTGQVSFTSGGQGRATNGFVTGTPDYAENITVTDSSIESGDIVTSVIYDSSEENVYRRSIASKSDKEYQGEIIGAISENPGFLAAQANLRDLPDRGWNDNERPLTVAGRIPLKVSSINGKIKVGDRITSSSKPGVGMKATEAGQTVGIAMEPYDNSDPNTVGKILVFIKVGFYDPDVYLTNTGDLNLEVDPATSLGLVKRDNKAIKRNGAYNEGVFGKLRAGIIEVTTITTDSLNIKTDEVRIGDKTLAQYIDSRAQNNGSTPAETEAKITSLQSQIDQLNSVLGVSTTSAEINQITSQINQTQDEIDSLNSENIASQGENGDFEKLHVSGNTLIEGMLTVIDPLKAGELVVTGTANFFDDVVFKGKVRFDNNVQFASNAAGAASISQGTKKVKVTFTKKFDNEPLINTTLTVDGTDTEKQAILNSGYVVAVTDKSETGFTIILNKAAEQDLKFNWSAVQVGN